MNGRMFFGLIWMALAGLASYLPDLPKGGYAVLIGNLLLGVMSVGWGLAAKGYFRKTDNPQQ